MLHSVTFYLLRTRFIILGCPENCKTTDGCNRVTSVCNDCKDGYFGPSCQQACSKNCLTPACEKTSGNCSDCKTGYFGPTCSSQCVEGCLGSRCNSTTGSCMECKPSTFGVQPCPPAGMLNSSSSSFSAQSYPHRHVPCQKSLAAIVPHLACLPESLIRSVFSSVLCHAVKASRQSFLCIPFSDQI